MISSEGALQQVIDSNKPVLVLHLTSLLPYKAL